MQPAPSSQPPQVGQPVDQNRSPEPAGSTSEPRSGITADKTHIEHAAPGGTAQVPTRPGQVAGSAASTGFSFPEDGIDTHLGGVFYLLNVMRQLDLPGIMADDWLPPRSVSPWATLDVLARALLAWEQIDADQDPIWWVLGALDGREPGHPPGEALLDDPVPIEYRIPPDWLTVTPPPEEYLRWATPEGRLLAWVENQYMLLDLPQQPGLSLAGEFGAALGFPPEPADDRSLPPYGRYSGRLTIGLPPQLLRWLELVGPFIRSYLCGLLTLPQQGALAEKLLFVPTRLYITSSHIDLVIRKESASIPVRIAGLDQNPNWLPSFGRVIQFHFR